MAISRLCGAVGSRSRRCGEIQKHTARGSELCVLRCFRRAGPLLSKCRGVSSRSNGGLKSPADEACMPRTRCPRHLQVHGCLAMNNDVMLPANSPGEHTFSPLCCSPPPVRRNRHTFFTFALIGHRQTDAHWAHGAVRPSRWDGTGNARLEGQEERHRNGEYRQREAGQGCTARRRRGWARLEQQVPKPHGGPTSRFHPSTLPQRYSRLLPTPPGTADVLAPPWSEATSTETPHGRHVGRTTP